MLTPMHSPLTNGHLAKSLNMPSRGVHFVSNNPVLRGRPAHALLRMLKRITQHCEPKESSTGRVTHSEWERHFGRKFGSFDRVIFCGTPRKAVQSAKRK